MPLSRISAQSLTDGTIVASEIADGAIATAKIADDAVTSAKIDTNIAVAGTLGVTGQTTLSDKLTINFNGSGSQAFKFKDTGGGNLASFGQFYNPSDSLMANIQNANNDGIHVMVGNNGSLVFDQTGYNATHALDDYEIGSWTPVLGGATSDPTVSYTGNNAGAYTKIGNVVHAIGRVNTTSVSGGSGTALIRGLPFATSGARNAGAVGYISQVSNSSGYTTTGLNPDANASTMRIVQSGSGLGGATVSIGNIGNGFDVTFSHTYRV